MNKPTKHALLAVLIAIGTTTAVMAQDAAPPVVDSQHMHALPDGQVSPYVPTKVAQQSLPKPGDRGCLQTTGSLIPAKPGTCLPVHGNSYTQDDIKRTGEPDTARALQMLDPSITVHGGH